MNYLKIAAIGLALSSAGAFANDCTAPEAPALPDGASATMDEMLAGQQAVKAFQTANLEYMDCVDGLIKAAAPAEGEASEEAAAAVSALHEQYNGAVSAEEEIAGQFNTEIREYKANNP